MKKIILTFFSAVFLSFAANAHQQNEQQKVENFINGFGNDIIKIASNSEFSTDQKRQKMVDLVDKAVDAKWISKFTLGKHYRRAKKAQRAEFAELYRQFMINTYSPKFTGYSGENFSIKNVKKSKNYYIVKCLFYPKNEGPTVNLDFRVRKNKKGKNKASQKPKFLIFDVIAEGVSLIETQRSEFGSAISKNGLSSFIKDLRGKVENLKKNPS